ncbi:hypothetical protein EV694_0297 [Volucribacter psittacicida]|uniref:Uncharacterized protein n=1 Tax=Volucribacter psittacicida TaxID=203482 RepID=A0A4R1G0U5_9PAST|nr:hypothetical protein [Volucribacter psittacicida]TCK01677.1 hypothetical protein EV694_0297 [Volucribacter psittacicida]
MKCRIAKQRLLSQAIEHYLNKRTLFHFMSLYDDNEPYPLGEVVLLLSERLESFKRDCEQYPNNESYQMAILQAEKQLKRLIKFHQLAIK